MPTNPEETSTSIIVTCQQTRFHLIDAPASKEIDIKGLNITVAAENVESTSFSAKAKAKAKTRGDGLEILASAELRLRPETHYALVGPNGSGKSTILRAIAEKLIPGIPLNTRVSILQQTASTDVNSHIETNHAASNSPHKTVLQQVVEGDTVRNEILHEVSVLSKGVEDNSNPLAPLKAFRQVRHERLQKDLFEVQKTAKLRSGARGSEARKVLIAYEKKVAESIAALNQSDGEINNGTIEEETKAAVDLLMDRQSQLETMQVADIEARARVVLSGLGFKGPMLEKPYSTLSGGWRMRCMLASALVQTSDIIILDEPTNFLDMLGIIWLQHYLADIRVKMKAIVLLVSHDRDFVDTVCEEVIILKDQTLTYFNGNLSAYETDRRHQTLRMSKMKEAQDRQVAHMEKTIHDNIKVGKKTGDDNKLRMAKSRQKKVDERMGMQVSATGGKFKLSRDRSGYHDSLRGEIIVPQDEKSVHMVFPQAPELRFPGSLISFEKVDFKYTNNPNAVLQDINLVIHMGDRVGILGLNGAGKSTLIKLVVEHSKPTRGTIVRHSRLRIGYYSQHAVEELQRIGQVEPTLTALGVLMRKAEEGFLEQNARKLLASMGLTGRIASDVPIIKLSGGQLVRLALSLILQSPPHLLVLDEITTHLDFHTVVALVGALSAYEGALLIVSHDRFLIRCVIQGEAPNPDEDREDDEDDQEESNRALSRRSTVYELKSGKLIERSTGVKGFEQSLIARVKKMAV